MNVTYIASDNSAGDAQTLGAAGQDIYIHKIFFGAPTAGKITHIYNKSIAGGHASGMASVSTNSLAWYLVQPTAAAGNNLTYQVDFDLGNCQGLQVDGGSVHTDDDKVTIVWEPVDEAKG